jgi:hypothetical protein
MLMNAGKLAVEWLRDPEFLSASQAEHAFVGAYELVAFDIPPTDQFPTRDIGWELFGEEQFMIQLATGKASSFAEAKAAAEAELTARLSAPATPAPSSAAGSNKGRRQPRIVM